MIKKINALQQRMETKRQKATKLNAAVWRHYWHVQGKGRGVAKLLMAFVLGCSSSLAVIAGLVCLLIDSTIWFSEWDHATASAIYVFAIRSLINDPVFWAAVAYGSLCGGFSAIGSVPHKDRIKREGPIVCLSPGCSKIQALLFRFDVDINQLYWKQRTKTKAAALLILHVLANAMFVLGALGLALWLTALPVMPNWILAPSVRLTALSNAPAYFWLFLIVGMCFFTARMSFSVMRETVLRKQFNDTEHPIT